MSSLMETIIIVVIAVSAHYITEYMSTHPEYLCPTYCDVDHKHFLPSTPENEIFNEKVIAQADSIKKISAKSGLNFTQIFQKSLFLFPRFSFIEDTLQQR